MSICRCPLMATCSRMPSAVSFVEVLQVGVEAGCMCLASGVGRASQEVAVVALCPSTRCQQVVFLVISTGSVEVWNAVFAFL